jgi:hypothetical protein
VNPRTALDDIWKRKFLTLPGLGTPDPMVIQPVTSCYYEYPILAPLGDASNGIIVKKKVYIFLELFLLKYSGKSFRKIIT